MKSQLHFKIQFTLYCPTNKKTRYLAGVDVVKRIELFQQYHLLGLPDISFLYSIQVKTCAHGLTRIISCIPLNEFVASFLLNAY